MSRAAKRLAPLVALLLGAACAPRPPAAHPAPATLAFRGSTDGAPAPTTAAIDASSPQPATRAANAPTEPAPRAPLAKAPRLTKARSRTKPGDLAAALVSGRGESWGGETLRVSRCPKGGVRTNAETRITLPATAYGFGLVRGGDKIFAAAYLPFAAESQPTTSLLFVLDDDLRVLRRLPLGAHREGRTVSSLAIAADDRYLATYENDVSGGDTATVTLLDAGDLRVVAKATVGASRALGGPERQRLVMTEDDLYVLASILPARRARSTGDDVVHASEEYVVTRLALPTLAVVAQRPLDIYELGDASMTLRNGELSITDGLRLASVSLDLAQRTTVDIPPRNAPPPPPRPTCGERPPAR